MRKPLMVSISILAAIALSGCSMTDQPNGVAVRGYQAPGGWGQIAEQKVAVQSDVAPGQSVYVGASADGSVMGFMTAGGTIHWYQTSAR